MPTSPENSSRSQSASTSTLDRELQVAIIFADLFHREALRAMLGNANQLKRARVQLRACLDKIDQLLQEKI